MRRTRLLPLVASLVVAVVALAGCGSGPSRLGAAAIVGDTVIPIETIQQRLQTAGPILQTVVDARAQESGTPLGAPIPPEVLADRSRALVSIAVQHELIAQESRREAVTVPDAQVDAAIERSGGLESLQQSSGFDPGTVRELLSDGLALAEIGRRSFDGIAVRAEYATLPDRAAAEELLARATAGPGAAEAAFNGLPAGVGVPPQVLRPGAATSARAPGGPDSVTSVAYGLPVGGVALVPGASGPGQGGSGQPWTVVSVLDRTTTANGPGAVPASAAGTSTLAAFGLRLLQLTAVEQGVTLNPRYGVWDPTQLAAVGSSAEAGVIRTAAPTAP